MDTQSHGVIHFSQWDQSHIPEILEEIYIQKIYAPFLAGKRGGIFLDIGLNIGLWSFYASPIASKIYAFEPTHESFLLAKQNMEDNHLKNVVLFQKAITATDGKVQLYHSQNSTMNSLNSYVDDTKEKEEVEGIRLDTFCKQEKIERIDFAKIDIEGTEDILFQSDSFKNVAHIIKSFVYEWHGWCNANPFLINEGLKAIGYRVKQIPAKATLFFCDRV